MAAFHNLQRHDAIVIGASAGGLDALSNLCVQFGPDLAAAVFVVLHVSAEAPGYYARQLDRAGPLPVKLACHDEPVQLGHVYVAPPDRHLLLGGRAEERRLVVARGPKENRSRPAIDPLFRSAALAYGARTVGVLLTGLLDDGVAGLAAIQRCGGVTVVQDPADALYPDLPRNALANVDADHVLPIHRIGALLRHLTRTPVAGNPPVPEEAEHLEIETCIAQRAESNMQGDYQIGTPAPYGCPECGGPLWMIEDDAVKRFRCHVGHAFTANTLLAEQTEEVERTLWVALRTLEERAHLLEGMTSDTAAASDLKQRAADARRHAHRLRKFLLEGGPEVAEQARAA